MINTRKVYSAWQRRREVPQIKLQGAWLASAGLKIGAPITVRVDGDRLIIEPAEASLSRVVALPQYNAHLIAA